MRLGSVLEFRWVGIWRWLHIFPRVFYEARKEIHNILVFEFDSKSQLSQFDSVELSAVRSHVCWLFLSSVLGVLLLAFWAILLSSSL